MSVILAQIKKDIQSQRNSLILWGIGLGGIIFLLLLLHLDLTKELHGKNIGDLLSPNDMIDWWGVFGLVALLGLLSGTILLIFTPLLVIGIVHQDNLVGTTAFWMTRPIGRGKLLAAKVILIVALILSLLFISGANSHDSRGHLWVSEFAWIAAFAALASITSEMRQLLGYGLALIIGKAIFAGILATMWIRYFGPSYSIHEGLAQQNFGALKTPQLNATDYVHLIYFIGFSIVIIHQYLTLERKRSLAILITVLAVACLMKLVLGSHGIL